ncbi:uncharacterized protein A4U43_C05F32400 [Asparagus officinalis]|uniref:Uncharacterized protein n=1 Tax=Asparagus officinalis TaxID=4686 RepID=A0A5P1F0I3_ASPOF|nr:uncharacterized protein A4U43_C05F32400 [Asparagus officinalis]
MKRRRRKLQWGTLELAMDELELRSERGSASAFFLYRERGKGSPAPVSFGEESLTEFMEAPLTDHKIVGDAFELGRAEWDGDIVPSSLFIFRAPHHLSLHAAIIIAL